MFAEQVARRRAGFGRFGAGGPDRAGHLRRRFRQGLGRLGRGRYGYDWRGGAGLRFRHSLDRGGRGGRGRDGLFSGLDAGDDFIALHDFAVLLEYFGEHAVIQRGDFQRDLVGLDIDQVVTALHIVAGLFLPAQQGGLGDGFGQNGYFYINQHGLSSPWVAAGKPRAGRGRVCLGSSE